MPEKLTAREWLDQLPCHFCIHWYSDERDCSVVGDKKGPNDSCDWERKEPWFEGRWDKFED